MLKVLVITTALLSTISCTRLSAIQQSLAEVETQNDSLRATLARYEKQYLAPLTSDFQTFRISQDLKSLQIEEKIVQLSGNVTESYARLAEIQQRTGELTSQLREKAVKDSLVNSVAAAERKDIFDQGVKLYQTGKFSQAVNTFKAFMDEYPSAPEASDALYIQAESYLGMKKYANAESQFKAYIKQYPTGTKYCSAIYKLGITYEKSEQNDLRDEVWTNLKKICPNSKEAQLIQ